MPHSHTHPLQGVQLRRQMLDISAKDAAKALGMTLNSYYRLERGERGCLLSRAYTLANLLNCAIADLATEPTVDERIEALRKARNDALEREVAQLRREQHTIKPVPAAQGGEIGCVVSSQEAAQAAQPPSWHQPVTTIDPEIAALAAQLERGYDEEDSDEQ